MASAEDRLDQARRSLQLKKIRPAVKLLRSILQDTPDHIESLDLLAKLALRMKNFEYAKELLERAILIWPRSARLHANLGRAHHGLGQWREAINRFQQSLSINSRLGMTHYYLGLSQFEEKCLNDAGHSFQKAIALLPDFLPAYYRLADTLAEAGKLHAAVEFYQKFLKLAPHRDDAYVDLGNVLRRCDNDTSAADCFQKALELNPDSVSALNNWANLLRDYNQPKKSAELLKRALAISPNNAFLHNGLGLALEKTCDFELALASYHQAIALKPDYGNAHYNLAGLQQEFGNLALAEKGYLRAIEDTPEKAEPQFRLGCLRLLQSDFAAGWPGYEKRWGMREAKGKDRHFNQPTWDGSSLQGKTILVYTEQGLGDSLQFVRYLKLLKKKGATVFLQCQPRLATLLSRCAGIDQICTTQQAELPEFDVQVALLSLPMLLATTVETIPADAAYLFADNHKIAQWKDRLSHFEPLRVGIAWQGKASYFRDNTRSIPLAQFATLTELPNVQLVSLQKGPGAEQLQEFAFPDRILDLSPELDLGPDAFEDTAAVIKNLDLVITSDTSLAHLAGGLGTPTWVALGRIAEWRWLLDRDTSPWYPSMRLFRQPHFGDWPGAFSAIRNALEQLS